MTKEQLQDIFRQPYNAQTWQDLLINLFGATEIRHTPKPLAATDDADICGFELGNLNIGRERIGLYAFEIKNGVKIDRNRVGLRKLVSYLTKYVDDAALVVYYNDTEWRVSYICDLDEKLKTAPKRFTYVFGNPAETYRTATDMLFQLSAVNKPNFETIKAAFSVEALSKDFFKGYKEQYTKFCKHIGGDEKWQRDFVKKMMGRLVFLQFLQKKGWMGVPAESNCWEGGDMQYTQNLMVRYNGNDKMLSEVLEPLFFDTLNSKREGDIANPKLGGNIKIPYLNGGLFDKDDTDHRELDFEYSYFKDLLDFFSQYNFTIDENDPNDAEVGIDPEMLGHIFENLLEDNNDKGAFYTPKEIVQYMCRESLIQYLISHTDEDWHRHIKMLVNEHKLDTSMQGNRLFAETINRLLKDVKICDPAIGSGAFPMGLLNEIFAIRRKLYPELGTVSQFVDAEIKKEIIQNNIYGVDIEQGAVDIARLRFWLSLVVDENEPQPLPNLDYKIMQGNSLLESYEGEDLSVLYIETEQTDLFSNTRHRRDIIDLQKKYFTITDHSEKNEIKEEINEIIIKHLSNSIKSKKTKLEESVKLTQEAIHNFEAAIGNPSTTKGHKAEFQKRVDSERKNLVKMESTLSELKDKARNLAKTNETNRPYFLWHLFFKDVFDRGGFDIVIGNPPYIQLQANSGELAEQLKNEKYETFARTGDIYCLFYERGMQILKNGGIETMITSNKWMRAGYGEKTRLFFTKNNPLQLIDLGAGVFESATVDTNILIAQKGDNMNQLQSTMYVGKKFSNISLSPMSIFGGDMWIIIPLFKRTIQDKINKYGTPLKDWDVEINYGIKTGYNDAFIIDTTKRNELVAIDSRSAEIIKPILRGRNIKRYSPHWDDLWLITTHNGVKGKFERIKIEDYPAVKAHLDEYWTIIEKRVDQGDTPYNLRNCAYFEDFAHGKIMYPNMTKYLPFIYDEDGYYSNDKSFILKSKCPKYLVGVMNSKVSEYWIKDNCPELQGGTRELRKVFMENLPIPIISDKDQQPIIRLVDKILDSKKAVPTTDTSVIEAEIDSLVYALYNLTEDEIKIIENK